MKIEKNIKSSNGTQSIDVSDSIKRWHKGSIIYGWLLKANKNSNLMIRSEKWKAISERPMITVIYK